VAQLLIGSVTTFVFYIAILYAITSLDSVISSPITELPLAAVYLQATGSKAGTTGLLVIFLVDLIITIPGAYITCGRMLWTLARDDATPFSKTVSRVSPTFRNPFNATLICGGCCTILGCVFIGSATAFNAFVGVFTILTTMSYLAAILPHIISRRAFVIPGPFWMPAPIAYTVMGTACAYIIVFNVIYCFPYALPVNAQTMNYSCLMSGGMTIFVSVWYLWKRTHGYVGPRVVLEANDDIRMESLVSASAAGVGEKTA
jgi:choline transport protein